MTYSECKYCGWCDGWTAQANPWNADTGSCEGCAASVRRVRAYSAIREAEGILMECAA
ncbi:MAG: hypothetical protein OXE50_02230 [Chloroflexi bacterium]|nr:hypothetical protein [Chloroflexota bacterium]